MKNRFKTKEYEFIIQSCYYIDEVIRFNIGIKRKDIWIYESGSYYSFDDYFRFDNTEMLKKDRDFIHTKFLTHSKDIINKLKDMLK